jgi:hypothetical protein
VERYCWWQCLGLEGSPIIGLAGSYQSGGGGSSGVGSGRGAEQDGRNSNASGGGSSNQSGGRGDGGGNKNNSSIRNKIPNASGGKNNHNNKSNNNNNNNNNHKGGNSNKSRSKALEEIELRNTTESGTSAAQKAVHRVSCAKLLSCRLQYLDALVAAAAEAETEDTPTLEYTPHKK